MAEHVSVLTLVGACLAMAFKDAVGTLLVIAEARGRANLAGLLDAGGDLAFVLVNVIGAGAVIKYGWNYKTIGILAAMMFTSYVGTRFWTTVGARLTGGDDTQNLADRVADLEAALLARNVPVEPL